MRKSLLVGLIGLVALGACTTKKDDEAVSTTAAATSATTATSESTATTDGGSTASTFAPVVDDRAPGVTDDTIKVGITYVDFSTVGAILGFDHGDYEGAYNAVIDDINANGGIHGRTLEAVYAPVDPSVNESPAAACTKLTQDEEVFVAVGFFLDDEPLCYVDVNETPVIGGSQTAERLAKAKVAWYTTDVSEDQAVAGFGVLAEAGRLSENLAVVGSAGDEALYEETIKPVLEAAGISPVDVAFIDVSSGDANATYASAEALSERFKADGADQVLIVGTAGGFFPGGLARTDYRPMLVFQDLNSMSTYTIGEGNDLSVMEGAIATAAFDTVNDYETLGSPTSECVDLMEAAGLTLIPADEVPEGESQQIGSSLIACRTIGLLVAILEKAGAELNYGTFTTAGNNLGDVLLASSPDPWHFGPPPSADGDPQLYIFAWDSATQTIELEGP